MKRLLIGLSLFVAACSGSTPTTPSVSDSTSGPVVQPASPAPTAETGPGVDPNPPAPGANAATPQYTFTGPIGCVTAGTDLMQWVLNVSDAGPSALRFSTMTPSDGAPGCEPTVKNSRDRVRTSGVEVYSPHSSGQTTFTFNPRMYNCGRVQVDVSMFDLTGKETLLVGMIVNYGTACAPPPPQVEGMTCAPAIQTGALGQPVSFNVQGGSAPYTWSAPAGTPTSGTGGTFTTRYNTPVTVETTYTVTVSSGAQSATCQVRIPPPPSEGSLQCTPATQNVRTGQNANFTVVAQGVPGPYSWTAAGGNPQSGAGVTFATSYLTTGPKTVTVSAPSGASALCQVTVTAEPPALVCTPPSQSVALGQPASLSASGGDGSYSWSAVGGSTTSGTGPIFSTSYMSAGPKTVSVSSAGQTVNCTVTVIDNPPLVCAPVTQQTIPGYDVSFSATGGTGSYTWEAPPDGIPATGSGATFITRYDAIGTGIKTVTVRSGSASATCQVTVVPKAFSCEGVTATIGTPLLFPTGTVSVAIPAGQQANIQVWSTDLRNNTIQVFDFPAMQAPGRTLTVGPMSCFPKLQVMCEGVLIDPPGRVLGTNQCTP